MSAIHSALDEMFAVDDSDLSVGELAADVAELSHVAQMVDVLRSRKTRSLSDRGGHHQLGYSSPTAFLVDQTGMSPGRAKRIISYGNAKERRHRTLIRRGSTAGCPPTKPNICFVLPKPYPTSTPTPNNGWLTDIAGEAFEAILDANAGPPRDGDTRTPRQRRHDALDNLCRDWLDNGTIPIVGGEKPHIVLHADLEALQGIAGGLHEPENGNIVDIETLRMIACDCSVTRIVLGPESEVLDVGRKTRVWSPAQRRAIIARDRHCQGPGVRADHGTATYTTNNTGPVAEKPR